MSSSTTSILAFFFLLIQAFSSIAQASVPAEKTFQFINQGDVGPVGEYGSNYRALNIFSGPFQLCFYNTTPGLYTLALSMGSTHSSLVRWVWEANRGNPVGEHATFTFGADGNLVLAEENGHIVWQSGTSDLDVYGFKLWPNGNMVLFDTMGTFVWQSFDHPTDTLLVGQSLRLKGPNKLVSRTSEQENKDGAYSMILESDTFNMFYTTKNTPKPMVYYDLSSLITGNRGDYVKFNSKPHTSEAHAYDLEFEYQHEDPDSPGGGSRILARPNYNTTLTFLRLGIDGNLKAYTYYEPVFEDSWEVTYTLFTRENGQECQLPERCGSFGLCEDSQCIACPLPSGLMGWSKNCQSPNIGSCTEFQYYRVEGVNHFLTQYTKGSTVKEDKCSTKCSKDCMCLGYFYHIDPPMCWIAYELKTLIKSVNSTHVGYIKAPTY